MSIVEIWDHCGKWPLQLFLLLLAVGGNSEKLHAQTQSSALVNDLAQAQAFITSSKHDSANLILSRLTAQLKEQQQLDAPFGLRVQLAKGTALMQSNRDLAALQLFLHVKERSQHQKLWNIYTKACLELANLHESMKRSSQCLASLKDAQAAIEQHDVDSLYPVYAIRMASYHRVLSEKLDTAAYYAQEALRTAPRFNLIFEEAWGHMLMASIFRIRDKDYKKMMEHFQAAGTLFLKIDDHAGLIFLMTNISRYYLDQKELKKALIYNDSALAFAQVSILSEDKMSDNLYITYRYRGEIYREMGQTDSVWHYMKKTYDLQLSAFMKRRNEEVIEIDARYNDEKRLEEIAAQAREIRSEKTKRNLLALIAFIVLLLASSLAYFYRQLQKANRNAARQAEQLKDLDAAKSRFFANISHELRTPLTLILGPIATVLNEKQLTQKQVGLLEMATRNGEKLNHLINEILDLRKLEAGKMELNLQPTPLAVFFRRHFSQFESLAYQKGIDFLFDIAINDELVANIDQEKCRQLVYNLLSNAFKFTPAGGQIRVKTEVGNWETGQPDQTTAHLEMSVADNGGGIHPDDLPFVFDRFFQTKQPGKPVEGGTGIGLSLCREYATLFGGKIGVESQPGKGATFQVEFPVIVAGPESLLQLPGTLADQFFFQPEDAAESARLLPTTPPVSFDSTVPTILVVEDNADIQDYIRLILQDKYNIITTGNGQEALDKLREGMTLFPELIISDLMMPVMDGYQLLEKLKSSDATRHIPVIMLTARAEAQDRLKALRIGVDDYLTKPFDEEELQVRIENLLVNSRNRRTLVAHTTTDLLPLPEEIPSLTISAPDREWLEAFEAYVQKHLSSEMLAIPLLAQEFAMSESTLLRQLKRLTGLSTVQYLQEIRLNQARQLLENRTYNSIAQVAYKIGYSDHRSFSRIFKQRFGKLPSDYSNN